MRLLLGHYREKALQRIFRLAGAGGYAKASGLMRKKLDAVLWGFHRRPAPA